MNPVDSTRLIQYLESLADTEDDRSEELISYLKHAEAAVREAALWALLGTTTDAICEPVRRLAAEDGSEDVRAAAVFVMGHVLYERQVYADEEHTPLPEAVAAVEQDLRAMLADPSTSQLLRRRALESLSFLEEEAVEQLIEEWARSKDELLRKSAAFAMGRAQVDRFAKALVRLLDDTSTMVMVEAVRSVGEQGLKAACPRLAKLARGDHQQLAMEAIQSLAQIGGRSAEITLKAVLREGEPERRALAKDLLAELAGD